MVSLGRSIPVPANKSISHLALSPSVQARLKKGFSDFAPDVVHLHEPLQAGVSIYTLLLKRRPPIVATFHAAADRMAFYDWLRPFFERLIRRIDVAAAVSPAARELIARHFGENTAARLRILPNGLEASRFTATSTGFSERDSRVLFVGRLERRKGCGILLDAWSRIHETLSDYELWIVGEGPLRAELESRASTLPRIRFLGRLADDQLVEAYRSSRVVCVPSLTSESFGIVILEAMAAGACVVASDLPGYRWVGGDAALYFEAGDPTALAECLIGLLSAPHAAQELVEAGLRRAARFEWSRLLPDVLSAYEDAIEMRGLSQGY